MPPRADRFFASGNGKVGVRAGMDRENPASDAELLRAVTAGERWAAEALYDRIYPSIAASLQRVLRHPTDDYDDLVQTTFERVIRSLLDRGDEVANISGWASAIATHVALDALRVRVRERRYFQADHEGSAMLTVAGSTGAERQLEARRDLRVIQEVLAKMKPDLAEAVVLHDMAGHDLAETAALTKVTVAAAQSRLVRGRRELLKRVAQRLGRGT